MTFENDNIRLLVFDNMEQCTDEEVRRMLPLVSEQRRQQAMQFKFLFGQFACLKSYEMLMSLLGTKGEKPEFVYGEHGKPAIEGCDMHFSISHCKQGIAVAVSKRPIGIDIESFREADEALINMTMNADEARQIRTSPTPTQTFIELWTRKEAVLKLRGTGITDHLHDVLLGNERVITHTNNTKGYAYSIAMDY
ncbi:MAG: 4'-phosphopantetheinyl transferase superfamily protein [Bacteroidaceae bacterium]|nr:4'-phosphopantetheinyl transferase superfamily protein [Bacteroidaceae bacterium]